MPAPAVQLLISALLEFLLQIERFHRVLKGVAVGVLLSCA